MASLRRPQRDKPRKAYNPKPIPSIEEIELMLMNYDYFGFRQNLFVFRVTDVSGIVNHECDCLIMSKAGYLTEIEIKRSYADFLNDFKKAHNHTDERIRSFYYCIHESFAEKAIDRLIEAKRLPSGILVYSSDCAFIYYNTSRLWEALKDTEGVVRYVSKNTVKLNDAQKYKLAWLGSMRYRTLTSKIVKERKGRGEIEVREIEDIRI
ncbi:MAG: hypothetical protein ACRDDZ_01355 [Marinifilaceae bacterium]